MKERTPPGPITRGERRFLLAGAAALALLCALAFWFAVPFAPAEARPAAAPLEQAAWVDVNHADAAALCTLPGIGEQKARAILEYRAQNGPFASVEAVAEVPGITTKTVAGWGSLAYAG